MSQLTVEINELPAGIWSVSLKGSLDASNLESLQSTVQSLIGKGARSLLLGLEEARYVSSSGFSCFLKLVDEAAERGGRIVFVATPQHLRRTFKRLGLDRALAFASDQDGAIGYLSTMSDEARPTSG